MHPLHSVIAALRRELEHAIPPHQPADGQPIAVLDRTTLKLQVCFDTRRSPDGKTEVVALVASPSDPPTQALLHELTLELRIRTHPIAACTCIDTIPASSHTPTPLAPNPPTTPPPPYALIDAQLLADLSPVIGTPGFDSSARATVLREILQPLQPKDALAILDSLTEEAPPAVKPTLRSAHQRLRRILHLAKPGRAAGAAALRALIQQHPLPAIFAGIIRLWKTQNDWLDTPPPAP